MIYSFTPSNELRPGYVVSWDYLNSYKELFKGYACSEIYSKSSSAYKFARSINDSLDPRVSKYEYASNGYSLIAKKTIYEGRRVRPYYNRKEGTKKFHSVYKAEGFYTKDEE
jgi:hypothetical protein